MTLSNKEMQRKLDRVITFIRAGLFVSAEEGVREIKTELRKRSKTKTTGQLHAEIMRRGKGI